MRIFFGFFGDLFLGEIRSVEVGGWGFGGVSSLGGVSSNRG